MRRSTHVRGGSVISLFALLASTPAWCAPVLTDSPDTKVSVGGSEVENHVAISPSNPQVLLVSNIRGGADVSTWVSQDAGATWKKFAALVAGSVDPISGINPSGRFLLSHLHAGEVTVDYKETVDSTVSLIRGVVEPYGTTGWDKNFLWISSRVNGGHYPTFCGFSDAYGYPEAPPGRVYLRFSSDDGATWNPTRISVDAGESVGRNYVGIALATAPDVDNLVYATWASRVASLNQPAKAIMFR